MARQRFAKGLGGTLRFSPPEARAGGAPTSGTVTVKSATGADLPSAVVDQAVTVDGSDLTFALTAGNTPDPRTHGHLWRAVWTYVIAGITYQGDQTFEVNARLLKPTLSPADVEDELPASWEDLLGESADLERRLATAWNDVLDDLAARGFRADRILAPDRLERPHRARVLAKLYRSFGPEWATAADQREAAYDRDLASAISAVDWYDHDDSLTRSEAEKQLVQTVRLSR